MLTEYMGTVNVIIQLCWFKKKAFYEMIGIWISVMDEIGDVPSADSMSEGPAIGIPIGQNRPDLTLRIDRSDMNVTLANVDKRVCTVEASG